MPNCRNHASWGQGLAGKILQTGIAVVALLVGLRFERYALATTFRSYDDEGYVLLSLRHYLGGGHLYSEVFSQYGPFYFFAQAAFFRLLHLPVNHDAGRLVTLICWSLSALLAGYFVYKVSRSVTLASAAGLACMSLARALADEPGHPHQIILPILMGASCAALFEGPVSLLLLGAFGSLLFFIKINVGVFYFAAIAMTFVCRFPEGREKNAGVGLLFAYTAGIPLILMHRDLGGWARGYCLVAILCGAGTLLAGLRTTPVSSKPMSRVILYALAGAFSTAALIVLGTSLQGMSSRTLLDGVLWNPLKHPGVFEVPFRVSRKTFFLVLLLFGSIGGFYWLCGRGKINRNWIDALHCLSGLLVIALLTTHRSSAFFETLFPYAVILLPLGLLPLKGERWPQTDYLPRLFVTCLAATQFLQSYPVAGSQLYISSAPLLLCAFIWIHDSVEGMFHLITGFVKPFGDALSSESVLGGFVALALVVSMLHASSWLRRYASPPSSLPGSASLHLFKEDEASYESLIRDIQANCDTLFTLPGMGSLNLWSGVPTPNGLNLTAWMKGFNNQQQQKILQILQSDTRACVVYNADLVGFWETTPGDLDALPLARYILYNMQKATQNHGYEIRIHPFRTSPWIEAPAPVARTPNS